MTRSQGKFLGVATQAFVLFLCGCAANSPTAGQSVRTTGAIQKSSAADAADLEVYCQELLHDVRTVDEVQERLRAEGFTKICSFSDIDSGVQYVHADAVRAPVASDPLVRPRMRVCVVLEKNSVDVLGKVTWISN